MRVRQMVNSKNRGIVNQFIIDDGKTVYFQSYNTMVAKINKGMEVIVLRDAFNFSRTTSKYLVQFINEESGFEVDNKQARKYIQDGTFKVVDIIE